MAFDAGDRRRLLELARQAMEARVRGQPPPRVGRGGPFDRPSGAFVTIHHDGELRGCLGDIGGDRPLGETIARLGAAVSDSDPRFPAVSAHELHAIDVEISVLTPAWEIASTLHIEVGRHGLIVEQHGRRGLLLPQVAAEQGWDVETFLSHACTKASLPSEAWRHGARILVFEAEVFSEP